jgi:hypothetical protein
MAMCPAHRWKRPSRGSRALVDLGLGELRQRLVGFLFLGKRRLTQLYSVAGLAAGRFVEFIKHLFKPDDVLFGLGLMLLEGALSS